MLTYRVIGTEETATLIREILRNLDTEESDDAEIVLVSHGFEVPNNGLSLVFQNESLSDLIRFLNKLSASKQTPQLLIGRKHETFEPLLLSDILFFRSAGNALFAHTVRQAYELKHKLYEMEKLIICESFIRVNKSNIVNVLKIREIVPWFGGRLLLRLNGSDERIEVSRNYVKGFKLFLDM